MRLSTKEFQELISKNGKKTPPALQKQFAKEQKRANSINKSNKLLVVDENQEKKKSSSFSYKEIISQVNNAKIHYKYDKDERTVSIIFEDVKLITLNEMLAHLQIKSKRFGLFNYKKAIHDKISEFYSTLPKSAQANFKNKVDITLFRSGVRLIDNDSLPPSFKYYIDSLRECGIIGDDNPDVIDDIHFIQEKSRKLVIGIRIKELDKPIIKSTLKDDVSIFDKWEMTLDKDKAV